MSRILRRPMFRGGQVIDSRGTGITSGLYAAGGAVETPKRGMVDGPGSYSYRNLDFTTGGQLLNLNNAVGQGGQFDILNLKDTIGTSRNILDQRKDVEVGSEGDVIQKTIEDIFIEDKAKEDADKAKAKEMGVTVEQMKAIEKENLSSQSLQDQEKEKMIMDINKNINNNTNQPSNVEISAQDLIKENAELFKELLGEANKEDIKKARMSDVYDYALKFFEGTQKEGATLGSAAADVAAFATSKPSATDKAREAIKKTDQTATALAINDYIAGKRSKEDIAKALSLARAKVSLTEGTLGDKILKAKGSGPVTVTVIRDVLRSEPQFVGMPIQEFDSSKEKIEYSPGDENKIFIDTITKETFTYDSNKKRIPIYG